MFFPFKHSLVNTCKLDYLELFIDLSGVLTFVGHLLPD